MVKFTISEDLESIDLSFERPSGKSKVRLSGLSLKDVCNLRDGIHKSVSEWAILRNKRELEKNREEK